MKSTERPKMFGAADLIFDILFYKHKIFPSEFKYKYKAVLKGNTQIPQN